MRLLADECCDAGLVRALRAAGYDVQSIAEDAPGVSDDAVLAQAERDQRVLLTEDKDFGELAFFRARRAFGIVLVRIAPEYRSIKSQRVLHALTQYVDRLAGGYLVVQKDKTRFRPLLRLS